MSPQAITRQQAGRRDHANPPRFFETGLLGTQACFRESRRYRVSVLYRACERTRSDDGIRLYTRIKRT